MIKSCPLKLNSNTHAIERITLQILICYDSKKRLLLQFTLVCKVLEDTQVTVVYFLPISGVLSIEKPIIGVSFHQCTCCHNVGNELNK